MERIQISNKIRFEVFKRDMFTCQYCGKKTPDPGVVLNVDHINPVKEGGNNEIFNLVTSCFECNNGKSGRKLDDNSVLAKQRSQLELIEERKQQILLMIEWKKSLTNVDEDFVKIITDYINNKISPIILNENGITYIYGWIKKYKIEDILDSIDISAESYLLYHSQEIYNESAVTFLNKIGGILAVKNMTPIRQRISYISGIGKNRINTWDDKTAKIILTKYTIALQKYGWNEEKILEDLENEINPFTKTATKWNDWKNQIETWINNIQNWEKDVEYDFDEIDFFVNKKQSLEDKLVIDRETVNENLIFLEYIRKAFLEFNAEIFRKKYFELIISFLELLRDEYVNKQKNGLEEDYVYDHYLFSSIYFEFGEEDESKLQEILSTKAMFVIIETLDIFDYAKLKLNKTETNKIIKIQIEYYKSQLLTSVS